MGQIGELVVTATGVGSRVGDMVLGGNVGWGEGSTEKIPVGGIEGIAVFVGIILFKGDGSLDGAQLILGIELGDSEGTNETVGDGEGMERGSRQNVLLPSL